MHGDGKGTGERTAWRHQEAIGGRRGKIVEGGRRGKEQVSALLGGIKRRLEQLEGGDKTRASQSGAGDASWGFSAPCLVPKHTSCKLANFGTNF